MAARSPAFAPTISLPFRSKPWLTATHPSTGMRWTTCIMGCANQAGEDNRNVARMALLLAGLPESVPGTTMNRLCGSGMDAVLSAARAIKAGEVDLAIAGGVECMSRAPFVLPKAETAFSRSSEIFDTTIGWRFVNPRMQQLYGIDSMPETAENVAEEFAISREDQDALRVGLAEKGGPGAAKWAAGEGDRGREHQAATRRPRWLSKETSIRAQASRWRRLPSCPRRFASPER